MSSLKARIYDTPIDGVFQTRYVSLASKISQIKPQTTNLQFIKEETAKSCENYGANSE